MKTRPALVSLALLLPTLLASSAALADGTPAAPADTKAACLDAATKGQRFRDTHKLVEAREQLRVCAAAQCPGVVQTDCANWLAEVDKALPSVVLAAKNGAGGDLVDVRVSVDGQPLVAKLDGQAVPMNAGLHTFHFEGTAGVVDQQVVVLPSRRVWSDHEAGCRQEGKEPRCLGGVCKRLHFAGPFVASWEFVEHRA